MKKYYFILLSLVLLSTVSCSNSDELTPSQAKENYFIPDDNATDEESVLRRQFFNDEKCYLLFNDTLQHRFIGNDANGEPQYFTETVDISYTMYNTNSYKYLYKYMASMAEKKAAVDFLKKYILSHLSSKLCPFSWLLVNHITEYKSDGWDHYNYSSEPQYVIGQRCMAVSIASLSEMEDSEVKALAKKMLQGIVSNRISSQGSDVLKPVIEPVEALYGKSMGIGFPSTLQKNMEELNKRGFITPYWLFKQYNWIYRGYCPKKEDDLADFTDLVFNSTEEEVKAKYANYPIVVQRYEAMRQVFLNLGYVF